MITIYPSPNVLEVIPAPHARKNSVGLTTPKMVEYINEKDRANRKEVSRRKADKAAVYENAIPLRTPHPQTYKINVGISRGWGNFQESA